MPALYIPPTPQAILNDIHAQFTLHPAILTDLTSAFVAEFEGGLRRYGADMAMVPSFVTGVPDGTETGTFLALDLGGTNLRVCQVVLNGDKSFNLRQQKYKLSDTLKTGEARVLFDYLADSVDAFLTMHPPESPDSESPESESVPDVLPLGLTFSFPVEQTALGAGTILTWTKGFSAKNAVGHDVVRLLQDAFDRKHLHVRCVALVNDTVGALLSRAYTSGGCILGAIFGTGTNGAYLEKLTNIPKLTLPDDEHDEKASGYMVVNTEWGAFNNTRTHLPYTPFDTALDRTSINPRFQAFEKFVSGMYLGELTRGVLVALVDAVGQGNRSLLFSGRATQVLNDKWALDTSVMSEVEEAWEAGLSVLDAPASSTPTSTTTSTPHSNLRAKLERVRQVVLRRLGYRDAEVGLRDAAIVRWACHLVARRAALLSGVAVAAVLIQTGRAGLGFGLGEGGGNGNGTSSDEEEKIGVGVDGSLIQHYPHFERTMRESLRCIVGPAVERRVDIGLAKDGSGVGAALCALQALKQQQQQQQQQQE
ncbi:hypothetical protein F5876DRAFT_47169 [Lentinula aff. lateritia]|uniref:Uncharacterized protein n=1 Tax=Lentinula aff. lateritia TaxID=2804960 RepID=A0ACC1TTM4_9AGAR|nr:hypothetical protein F5876DRAFT_47169 [Lentinula aff. lateritia]